MLFGDHLVVLRGGGDLATGVAQRLHRAGFPIVVLELGHPLAVRRPVSLATAVIEGKAEVEDLQGVLVDSVDEAMSISTEGTIPVMVSPSIPSLARSVVVDARLAKRNLDTSIDQAALVVALGPGFVAGVDCHAVVETMRGHHLGRVIWEGGAAPDTGVPGVVGGASENRVLRADTEGEVRWDVKIGDLVTEGQRLGRIGDREVIANTDGVVRGLIAASTLVSAGLKLGDIDPRGDRAACFEISDKSLSVGGGVLEAVLAWLNRS
jgi:xanthine dehydrogenase accessory factor